MIITESSFKKLLDLKGNCCIELEGNNSRIAVCPDLGGRVFAEICGMSVHRIDLENIADPSRDFNNYGGLNFWPAPEGGKFGFNYDGDAWRVQKCINNEPFQVAQVSSNSVKIEKQIALVNRFGTIMNVNMRRIVTLSAGECGNCLSYKVDDSFDVIDGVSVDDGLIAAWTLEQFDASSDTVSYCKVDSPQSAINFDFYDDPRDRIEYGKTGFIYRTDGNATGQIGIKESSNAACIGFYDLSKKLLCTRKNLTSENGLYFNIADNDQPDGPFSAADNYSIYNSDTSMSFFELETVGSAIVCDGRVLGAKLSSETTFEVFDSTKEMESRIHSLLQI